VVGVSVGMLVTAVVGGYFLFYRGAIEPLTMPSARLPDKVMTLTVTPPWATITLDGREVGPPDSMGKLEIAVPGAEPSVAWLEISAEGYHGVRRPVSSYAGTQDVTIELIRMPYEVAVRTTPPQSEVWVDNEMKGYSPLTLSLLPNESPTLTVKREGYQPVSQKVSLPERGKTLEVELSLTVANVTLQVESDPPGAMIAMDGVLRGPAPLAVEMDPSFLGKDVDITATLNGYEQASVQLALPAKGGGQPIPARLALVRRKAEVELWTTPPGGRLVVDGRDMGAAPIVMKFEPSQVGTQVVAAASLAGTHYGRQELTVPPIGEPLRVTIPMEFNARKVVVVVSCPENPSTAGDRTSAKLAAGQMPRTKSSSGQPSRAATAAQAEAVVLMDQAVEIIHELNAEQRFALLLDTDDGVETWPGAVETEVASDEQKVRAYDTIRSARRPSEGRLVEAVRVSMGFEPDTVWLFTTGELTPADIEKFNEAIADREVALHIVHGSSDADDTWLRDWAAEHGGTVSMLGRDQLPTVAMSQSE
jgi:hypothetical protein